MEKISIFTASLGTGGSERVLSILTKQLLRNGNAVEIFHLIDPLVAYEFDKNIHIKFLRKHKIRVLNVVYWIRSIRSISRSTDRLIGFNYKINFLIYIATLGINVRMIACERTHPGYDDRNRFFKTALNYIYKRVDILVVQNKSIQNFFNDKVVSNSVVIPNLIELPLVSPPKFSSSQILAVGRLVESKNFNLIIDAFSIVLISYPNLKLRICGEGPLRPKLEAKIKQLGLQKNIEMPGIVKNIYCEYSSSILFVQSSKFEGQSNALLEAMLLGLPVLVTSYEGVDEVIDDGINGIIVDSKIEAVAASMKLILGNPNLWEKLSKSKSIYTTKYSTENVMGLWNTIISK